jgi:hypothetical protein
MQIQIEILTVGAIQSIPTKNGKSYNVIEVAYKKDGKIEGKKLMSFVSPSVFAAVQKFKQGDVCYVETEKGAPNAAGQSFWQWNSIQSAGDGSAQPAVREVAPAGQGSTTGTTQKASSSYPTNEERAATQVYIVRQSSLSNAIALANATGDKKATTTTIIAAAKEFEAFVLGKEVATPVAPKNREPVKYEAAMDDFEDDIPL